jgi:hypothetical protein
MDSYAVEITGSASDPISLFIDDEDMALEATQVLIDLTAIDDASNNATATKSEGVSEAFQHSACSFKSACSTQEDLVKTPWVTMTLYCGGHVWLRTMRMKRIARFETLTNLVCEQEQIPHHEARFLWNGKRLNLFASPDSYGIGEEGDIHLYHELAGPFKTYPWYGRLMGSHHSVTERQQDSEEETDLHEDDEQLANSRRSRGALDPINIPSTADEVRPRGPVFQKRSHKAISAHMNTQQGQRSGGAFFEEPLPMDCQMTEIRNHVIAEDGTIEVDHTDHEKGSVITDDASNKVGAHTTPQKRASGAHFTVPQTPISHDFPQLTSPSQAASVEPSPRAKNLAIDAGFGNYSFLNCLEDVDRRMWSNFLAERLIANDTLKSIANLYGEPRSPGFTRKLIEKVAEKYHTCQESIKKGNQGSSA